MAERDLREYPELMTSEEVATVLRRSPATVRYWRHMGTGPASFKVGRRRLYARTDVEAWLSAAQSADAV